MTRVTPSPTPTLGSPPPPPASPPSSYDGVRPAEVSGGSQGFVLDVPYRGQYDGSPYQNSNCGPAALGMVLQAYGIQATTAQLRAAADQLQGTTGYDQGVALDFLQAIAQEAGLRTEGLTGANGRYRQWSIADLIAEVREGHPVITLVRYATLPDHAGSTSTSDHYVVVIGVTDQGLIINDPAFTGNGGFRRPLAPDALMKAWRAASIPDQAVAFLPPSGKVSLAMLNTRVGEFGSAGQATTVSRTGGSLLPPPFLPPSQSLVPPGVPSPVPSPTGAVVDSAPPPPGPETARWAASLSQWQHQSPNARPSPLASSLSSHLAPAGATENRASGPALPLPDLPLPVFAVIALVGLGTMLILTMPGPGSD
ncbi:MAG: C39 family peptidase [Chloroflexota bacterium]